jgi:hypothetical protein
MIGPPEPPQPPDNWYSRQSPNGNSAGWQQVKLVSAALQPPEPPDIGGLVYPGQRHIVSGEAEAGKTWLMLALAASELHEGHGIGWVDTDSMGPRWLVERLRALGISDPVIEDGVLCFTTLDGQPEGVIERLVSIGARLMVFDSFNPSLTSLALDPNSTRDVEHFWTNIVTPFTDFDIAALLSDHVVKQQESRGRYAYGSERKLTGCDVHLGLIPIEPFGRERTGRARIVVHKDRPGFITRPSPGAFTVSSANGVSSWQITPDTSYSPEGDFRPTGYMERVSKYLEEVRVPTSRTQIVEGVSGKAEYVRRAIDQLIIEDYATEYEGIRGAKLVYLTSPFREYELP